jgi:hypothetical protein
MWQVMLAGLLVGGPNGYGEDQDKVRVGMTVAQVEKVMDYGGGPSWSAGDHFGEIFVKDDFLGGSRWWCVQFLGKCGRERVEKYTFRYTPFDHCPRWARQASDSFFLSEK